jgi:TonB family protein
MKRTLSLLTLSLLTSSLWAQSPADTSAAQQDRPRLTITDAVNPIMPERLRAVGILGGSVRMLISVDHTGKLSDILVIAYTNPDLADSCVRAVKEWKFEPPTFHGQPVSIQRELRFDFDSRGSFVTMDINAYVSSMIERVQGGPRFVFFPHTLKELDRIPTPLHTEHPVAPKGQTGTASVNFFIDTEGHVRMATIEHADSPELADAAAATVDQWSFEPPTYQGHPVLIRVSQTFRFTK